MRWFFALFALAGLFLPAPSWADEDLHSRAEAALKRYYAESLRRPFIITEESERPKENPPPWSGPLKQLSSTKPEERRQGAAYLRELLSVALGHEQSRTAPWRSTPYWGGGAEMPARDLRKVVAEKLAEAGPLSDAVPVFRWYVEKEPMDSALGPVMKALDKLDSKDADAIRTELAVKPHDNAVVAAEAMKQIAARNKTVPAERLAALCHHHRAAVREAARKLNAQQGGKDPGPFDAAKAVRSEPVRKVMDQVLALLTELPPAKAEFVKLSVRHIDEKKAIKESWDTHGWLIRRKGDTIEVYSPYGRQQTFHNGEKKRVEHSERSPDGKGTVHYEIDITVDVAVSPAEVKELVADVEASRKKGEAGNDLSEQGPLTGQFRGQGATLYEAILGAWLYRSGKDTEAAQILLPALDSLYRDSHFVQMVRGRLGEIRGYQMLVAFAGDRDYEQALRHARFIDEHCPDTRFHEYAKRFAKELPRRMDDFKKFKLPTPAEWAESKKKLTRAQQIDFLCERMRLLNCFQMGQPGGYWPDDEQYVEPCGMKENASWGLRMGKTQVINPLTELQGPVNWFKRDKPRPKGLELTLKDVPRLSKYLREDWYMLIVGFWRDFHPDRHLSTTRPQFAEIINGLAGKDICKIEGWDKLTPTEIDKEIERINSWAATNTGKSALELDWNALQEAVAAGADWRAIEKRVESLLKQKETRVYDVMKLYLENAETDPYSKSCILEAYLHNDVSQAKELAPKFLDAKKNYLRLQAALIVFQTGEKSKARRILGDGLANGEIGRAFVDAVDMLLKDGSAESRKQVARLFSNRRLPHERDWARVEALRQCAGAGMKEAYQFYLPLLDINKSELPHLDEKGKESGASFFHPTVAEELAREIVEKFAPKDPAIKDIVKKFPKTADQLPHLKKWLQERIDAKRE
jgi:hypothetical protein